MLVSQPTKARAHLEHTGYPIEECQQSKAISKLFHPRDKGTES